MKPLLLLGLGVFVFFQSLLAAQPSRPNIIFILTDDQRYDELGCTGHPFLRTPNLDALAREGVRFDQHFVTTAVCLPSRTTLVTGQWERAHTVGFGGGRALSAAQWANTLPAVLKRAGYFTGIIGKSNIPGLRQKEVDYYCASDKTFLGFYPREQDPEFDVLFRGAKATTQIEVIGEAAEDFLGVDHGFFERSTPGMKAFLRRRSKSQPFFLYLSFEVPHGTGTRTMQQRSTDDPLYRTTYRDQLAQMPLPRNYVAWPDVRTPKLPIEIYNGEQSPSYSYRFTPEGVREQMVRNCQTITGVDRLVGRLREHLQKLGLADNTVFVFTSDHGWMHGEWGYGGKCLLYEPSIRVPLIVYDPRPGAGRGVVSPELTLSPDVAPTLLDLCGLSVPPAMQGKSLVPLMRRDAVPWREDFFAECLMLQQNYPIVQGVRGKRWKYMRYWPIRPVPDDYRDMLNYGLRGEKPAYEELFDLETDPFEENNLASSPAHASQLQRLRIRCVELLRDALGRAPEAALPSTTTTAWRTEMKDFYQVIGQSRSD